MEAFGLMTCHYSARIKGDLTLDIGELIVVIDKR